MTGSSNSSDKENVRKDKENIEKSEHTPKSKKSGKTAIIHVFSSKNNTLITATDISGAETLAKASGGMVVNADREEGKPYAATQAIYKVINTLKEKGVDKVYVWNRAPGGTKAKTPGAGAQVITRALTRNRMIILGVKEVTPLPTDSMRRKGGRRGRRV